MDNITDGMQAYCIGESAHCAHLYCVYETRSVYVCIVHARASPAYLAREMKANRRREKETRARGIYSCRDTETRNYVAVAARR